MRESPGVTDRKRPSRALPVADDSALLVRPRRACVMLNCSEAELYRLIKEGRIESYKDGYIRRITVRSIHKHIAEMLAAPDPLREGVAAPPPASDAGSVKAQRRRHRTNMEATSRGA